MRRKENPWGIIGPSKKEIKELAQLKPKKKPGRGSGYFETVVRGVGAVLGLSAGLILEASCQPPPAEVRPHKSSTPTPTSTPEPTATLEPTSTPTPEIPAFIRELEVNLEEKIQNYQGEVALAVVDLQNGKKIIIKGEDEHLLGCTAKIFILLSVVRDLENGRYPQAEVDYAIDRMMGPSDDSWTKTLLDKTGLASVNQVLKEIGAQKSVLSNAPNWPVEDPSFGWENLSTASDLALILTKVYQGEFFSRYFSDYLLENMTHSWDRYDHNIIIPKLLPAGTTVAHKIGFFWMGINTYNDAGVVMAPEFSYVFVYLSQRNASYSKSPDFGAELSKMTYDAFVQEYDE